MTVLEELIMGLSDAEVRVVWADLAGVRDEADPSAGDVAAVYASTLRAALLGVAGNPGVPEKILAVRDLFAA